MESISTGDVAISQINFPNMPKYKTLVTHKIKGTKIPDLQNILTYWR